MTKISDYLKDAGILGIMVLVILICFFIILCPLFVSILLTNIITVYLAKSNIIIAGITWYALVIVFWFIIAGVIAKLRN